MKKTITILLLLILVFGEKHLSAQKCSLPTQNFKYSELYAKSQLEVVAKGAFSVYADRALKTKIGVIRSKQMMLCEFLPSDLSDMTQIYINDVIRIESKKFNGFINPYERRSILTLQVDIKDWMVYHKEKLMLSKRKERIDLLVSKYGKEVGGKLMNLKFERGMSEEMIKDAIGEPTKTYTRLDGKSFYYKNMYNLNKSYGYGVILRNMLILFSDKKLQAVEYSN